MPSRDRGMFFGDRMFFCSAEKYEDYFASARQTVRFRKTIRDMFRKHVKRRHRLKSDSAWKMIEKFCSKI